jgi:hypothetical protein
MSKNYKSLVLSIMTLLIACSVFSVDSFAQQCKPQTEKAKTSESVGGLPEGNWSVSFNPYQDDYFSPVFLHSVSSNRAAAVERFDIANISNKPVKAIKVGWLVYRGEDRNKPLNQGATRLLSFRNELPSGQSGFIKFRAVALNDFYQSFLVKNRLDGDFVVDVRIDEVLFADNSVWQRQDGRSPDIKSELESHKALLDCPKQQCNGTISQEIKGAVTYSCGSSGSLPQRCSMNGDYSCTNQSCHQEGGGGGEIILE